MHAQTVNIFIAAQPAAGGVDLAQLAQNYAARYFRTDPGPAAPGGPSAASETTPPPPAFLVPPAPGELWPGQGGYYIGQMPPVGDKPGYHLVVAVEEGDSLTWGGSGSESPQAAGMSSQHDGLANTVALNADSAEHPAARYAACHVADGHADFYLPSRLELLLCFIQARHLFKTDGWYWSSSQCSRRSAWCQVFENGGSYHRKANEFRARAVRRIQL